MKNTQTKARAFVARAAVRTLLAIMLATTLGACVYGGGDGRWHDGDGWHRGGEHAGYHGDGERR